MRPDGNEAGYCYRNPPAPDLWHGGFFTNASTHRSRAARLTTGQAYCPSGRGGLTMTALTLALVDYWTTLPDRSKPARLRAIADLRQRIAAGELAPGALLPYALGDADEDVVFAATSAWTALRLDSPAAEVAAGDAVEWVRRGLAINRGAVFAALLSRGDESLNARLRGLRLGLNTAEVETVCRHVARRRSAPAQAFLADWLALVEDGGMMDARECLARSLDGCAQVA